MRKGEVVNTTKRRVSEWAERIEAQEHSGVSVKQFCAERGVTEPSFYYWRKRLHKRTPMRFALVETGATVREGTAETTLELVMTTGERLRIGAGVDGTVLRKVVEALRA